MSTTEQYKFAMSVFYDMFYQVIPFTASNSAAGLPPCPANFSSTLVVCSISQKVATSSDTGEKYMLMACCFLT
jgi:hypothetical protein